MKLFIIKSVVVAGLAGSLALPTLLPAAPPSDAESRTDVVFFERERFADVRTNSFHTDEDRDHILNHLKTYLQQQAQAYVPEGAKLSVTIKQVDLAGDFEPWHGVRAQDIRIVKDIYPPRIDLVFKLTDANGEIVKQGTRQLRDMNFMHSTLGHLSDFLRYEKALFDAWLRTEFSRTKN